MHKPPPEAVRQLSEKLDVELQFLSLCLEESVIDVYEIDGHLELANASALRLRRVQRICMTFNVEVSVALMLWRQ